MADYNFEEHRKKVDEALEKRKKRISSNVDSIKQEIAKEYDSVVDLYKKDTSKNLTWGKDVLKSTFESTRESRLAVSNLKKKIEAYRSYLGEDADKLLESVNFISSDYNTRVSAAEIMSQYNSESEYDTAVKNSSWYKKYKDYSEDEISQAISMLQAESTKPRYYDAFKPFGETKTAENINELNWLKDYKIYTGYIAEGGNYKTPELKALEQEKKGLEEQLGQYNSNKGVGVQKKQEIQNKIKEVNKKIEEQNEAIAQVKSKFRNTVALQSQNWTSKDVENYLNKLGGNEIAYTTPEGKNVTWQDFYDKKKEEETLSADDFALYSEQGANLQNPAYGEEDYAYFGKWALKEDNIANKVTFIRDNYDALSAEYAGGGDVPFGTLRYIHMKDDEVALYNYYLAKYGEEKADEWLDKLDDEVLLARARGETAEYFSSVPVVGDIVNSMAGTAASIGSAGEYVLDAGKYLFTGEMDKNSLADAANIYKGAVTDKYDVMVGGWDAFDFVYNTGMSAVESLAASAVPGGFAVLGLSAAAQGTNDALNRGMSNGQAFLSGFFSGVAEGAFEYISLGKLDVFKKDYANFGKNLLKNMGINATEEFNTELFNIGYDYIVNGDFSQYETSIRQYMAGGLSYEEAKSKAASDIGVRLAEATASGGLMGGGMLAVAGGYNAYQYNKAAKAEGKRVISEGELDALKALANDVAGVTEGSASTNLKKLAEQVTAEQTRKNTKNVGKLSMEVEAARVKQNEADIVNALVAKGMSKKAAQKAASIINQNFATKEFSQEQWNEMMKDERTFEVLSELSNNETSSVNVRNAQHQFGRNGIRVDAEGNVNTEDLAEFAVKKAEEASNAGISTKMSDNSFDVSEDGKNFDNKTGKILDSLQFVDDNGTVKVKVDDETTVDAGSVSYKNEGLAAVVSTFVDMGIDAASVQGIVEMFDGVTEKDAKAFVSAVKIAFVSGQMHFGKSDLSKLVGKFGITAKQAEDAYRLGEISAQAKIDKDQAAVDKQVAEAEATAERDEDGNIKAKHEKGEIIFEGEISEAKMKEKLRSVSIDGLKVLAELSPVRFHIFESTKDADGTYSFVMKNGKKMTASGWYAVGTRDIWIDINAGDNFEGTMLWTAAHEISHYIKAWNAKEWKVLADFLIAEYERHNKPVKSMIEDEIRKIRNGQAADEKAAKAAGKEFKPMTEQEIYDAAFEEVVCEAMVQMFDDGTIVQSMAKLKQEKPNIWKKFKEAIKKILEKWGLVIDAYKDRPLHTREARAVAQMQDSFKKFQELYLKAFEGANYAASMVGNMVNIDADTQSVSPAKLSERTWTQSEYVTKREEAAKAISVALDVDVKTAYKYIDDINSVARLIADDRARLDYDSNLDENATVLKPNSEYKFSVDMSTLCAKRLLFTGTFDAIQRALPNTAFDSEDIVALREMMQKKGYEVACGICYVESTRREIGRITQEFIDRYKIAQQTGKPISRINSSGNEVVLKSGGRTFNADKAYTPNLGELNTTDIDIVKRDHREVYDAYLAFMNARGQAKPKLLETRAEYKGEILKHFKAKSAVEARNRAGGLRLQSFSDFEVPHLIDMMQIVMDMSRVGLKSQAYTKVPNFAEAFGNTGIKINLSLIAKDSGLDANGNLVFDDVEGINHKEAFRLRDKFSKNVGTILVGKNDAHIIAAMADSRIDFIIPFHKSSWKESLYDALGLTGYADYTEFQNEKSIDGSKIKNYDPSEYWDYSKTGDENAQIYLQKCRDDGRIPKFPQFQGYPGYWKLLIDFKMYDNDGVGSPQEVVQPIFNNEANEKILNEYEGGHRSFPVAKDVVSEFVEQHQSGGIKTQARGKLTVEKSLAQNYNISRANEEGDFLNEFHDALSAQEWNRFYVGLKNEGKLEQTKIGTPAFIQVGNKLVIAERMYIGKKDAHDYVVTSVYEIVNDDISNSVTEKLSEELEDVGYYGSATINQKFKRISGMLGQESILRVYDRASGAFTDDLSKGGNWRGSSGTDRNSEEESSGSGLSLRDRSSVQTSQRGTVKTQERNYAPVFYSKMEQVITHIPQNKFAADQVVRMLTGKGVKAEEIRWSGIVTFLEGKKSVTKQEMLDFINGSSLQIGEQMSEPPKKIDLREATDSDYYAYALYDSEGNELDRFSYDYAGELVSEKTDDSYLDAETLKEELEKEYGSGNARWSQYKLYGGENYREIVFTIPNSTYSNQMMRAHWGDEAEGVLAHARIQDFDVNGKKMLFIEEIQSDYHNEGHNSGYNDSETDAKIDELKSIAEEKFFAVEDFSTEMTGNAGEWETIKKTEKGARLLREYREAQDAHDNAMNEYVKRIPDAPFKETYHEYVLKRLIRMAAEEGYDSIGWTPAEIQSKRWSEEFAEGYRIEYDQDIPKFLKKYGKQWGAKVSQTSLNNQSDDATYVDNNGKEYKGIREWYDSTLDGYFGKDNAIWSAYIQGNAKVIQDRDTMRIQLKNTGKLLDESLTVVYAPNIVWYMDITDSMKNSVLYEGQAKFQERNTDSNRYLLASALESAAKNDIELKYLKEYKDSAAQIDALETHLQEVNAKIRDISFSKGTRDKEALRKLRDEATKTVNRISNYDKKLLRLEANDALKKLLGRERAKAYAAAKKVNQEVMREYREKTNERIDKIVGNYQESRKKAVEGRHKTEMRHKIKKVVKELNQILVHGTKERNVKIGLQETVRNALASAELMFSDNITNEDIIKAGVLTSTEAESKLLNEYTDLLAKRDSYHGRLDALFAASGDSSQIDSLHKMIDVCNKGLAKLNKSLEGVFERERKRHSEAAVSTALEALANAYKELENSEDSYIKGAYQDGIYKRLDNLKKSVGGATLKDMNKAQLQEVYDAFRMVKHMVTTSNRLFREGRMEDLAERVSLVQEQIRAIIASEKDPTQAKEKVANFLRSFTWNELKPYYAFERLGSDAFTELFWDAIEGEATYARDIVEAGTVIADARGKYGFSKWDMQKAKTYKTVNGLDFKLTLADMMSIYAYSKREQAYDHMTIGGFTFDTGHTYKEKKKENGIEKTYVHRKMSDTFIVDDAVINQIIGDLKDEQRAYVDVMQKYLTSLGEKGNEVSRVLFGINLFNEEVYFPLQSDKDYRSATEQALNATETMVSLKNTGVSKPTKPHANNPIVLRGFDDVVLDHIDTMSKYHAFVLPIESLQKVFDNVGKDVDGKPISTQALISSVFGESAEKYFNQYITDLNGGTKGGGVQNPLAKMFATAKGVSVSANLSVLVQQYFAVVRAMNELNPKYFVPLLNSEASKSDEKQWEELKKYAPVAVIKEMGGFDVGSSRTTQDYIGMKNAHKDGKYLRKKFQEATMWGATKMDELGWSTIWRAVKKEIADTTDLQPGTEEFLQASGKRFTEIVAKTQVYDSVNSRSGFMRSKHESVKYLTSFMGEPTTVVNMMFSSQLALHRAIKSKDKAKIAAASKKMARTATVLILSAVITSLAKSFVYGGRDDEEDEALLERWMKQFGMALRDDMNPLNLIPLGRDIVSLWEGWDVERPDLTLIADAITAFKKVFDDDFTAEEAFNLAGAIANIFGIPLKNVVRDAEAIVRIIGDVADDIHPTDVGGAFGRGFTDEEQSKTDALYYAIVNGDSGKLKAIKAQYKTDSAYKMALRQALIDNDPRIQEAVMAEKEGNPTRRQELVREIKGEGYFDFDIVQGAVNNAITTFNSKAEKAKAAQAKGDTKTHDDIVKELLEKYPKDFVEKVLGETIVEPEEEETSDELREYDVEDYYNVIVKGDTSQSSIIYDELISELVAKGNTEAEAEKSIESSFTTQAKNAYMDGTLTRSEAAELIETYGGYDGIDDAGNSEAEAKINEWDFEIEYDYSWSSRDNAYRLGAITKEELITAFMDIEGKTREEAVNEVKVIDFRTQYPQYSEVTKDAVIKYYEPIENANNQYSLEDTGLSIEQYAEYYLLQKSCKGTDADGDGETDYGSQKAEVMAVIDSLPISTAQKDAIYLTRWKWSKIYEAPWH